MKVTGCINKGQEFSRLLFNKIQEVNLSHILLVTRMPRELIIPCGRL